MGQVPSILASPTGPVPDGARFRTVVGTKAIAAALRANDDALTRAALRDPELERIVTKSLGKRSSRCDDASWEARKRSRFSSQFSATGARRVAVFVFDGAGAYVGAGTADVPKRARTVEVGAHFTRGAPPARRAILAYLLRALRLANARTAKTDAPRAYLADFSAAGFRALKAQDPGRPDVIRMTRDLGRWDVVSHVVCLAELLRRDRATVADGAGDTAKGLVPRLLLEVAGSDRDHWSAAFLRRAILLL